MTLEGSVQLVNLTEQKHYNMHIEQIYSLLIADIRKIKFQKVKTNTNFDFVLWH